MDRLFGPRRNGTTAEGHATPAGVPSNVESRSQRETEPASAGANAIRPVAQSQLGTRNLPPAVQAKTSAPVSAPNAINRPSNHKDHAQAGIASAPASPSVVAVANPSPAQVQAVPGGVPDTLVYQNNVHQNNVYQNTVHQNLVQPNKEQTRNRGPSVPVPQNAVSVAKPAQSQVGTGPSSQPENPNAGRTIYPDEPRRSPYAIDFDFRLPGCRR
jgi:hypothetical protein